MSLILDGTNGVSDINGSAATPAIRGADANTGIFFPAVDTIAFAEDGTEVMRIDSSGNLNIGGTLGLGKVYSQTSAAGYAYYAYGNFSNGAEGGLYTGSGYLGLNAVSAHDLRFATSNTERMRIDSSGNVGIGVTPNSWGSSFKVLQLASSAVINNGTNDTFIGANYYFDGANNRYINTDFASAYGLQEGDHRWYTAPSGTGGNTATFTERMRIDSSGDYLFLGGTLRIKNAANNTQYGAIYANSSEFHVNAGVDNLVFTTAGGECARFTAAREFLVRGTTDQGAYNIQCNGTGVWGAGAYVNGSDERIKDDIQSIESGLDVVEKLNPVTYRYKEEWSSDQSVQTGFIAQELLVALEGKNYVDGIVQQGGAKNYYSVAYQNIIPILTKAIQELKAELDATKAEVAAMKALNGN